jgi:GntR family transcriptional regulator, transcriptional repressor for pyruvate dehydrogenase complex
VAADNPVGAMSRRHLSDQVVEALIEAIVNGRYGPDEALPSEAELAALTSVSRLTIREAVKALQARGVVRVEQGRGTFVNPPSRWSQLDPLLLAARSIRERVDVTMRVLEARRLVEVSVAEIAAARRTDSDLDAMEAALERMEEAQAAGDVDSFVDADIHFHNAIMRAAGNAIVTALFEPIGHLVYETRRHTSSFPEARVHAIAAHRKVLRGIRSQSATSARNAMRRHLEQTEADLEGYAYGGDVTERTAEGRA